MGIAEIHGQHIHHSTELPTMAYLYKYPINTLFRA